MSQALIEIPAEVSTQTAFDVHASLVAAMEANQDETELTIAFSGPQPTILAEQLAYALDVALREAGKTVRHDETWARVFDAGSMTTE